MDINWTEMLTTIQEVRAQLENYGISYDTLIVIGALAAALFMISLREIIVWYFRIGQLHDQMRVMHDQLIYIRKTLEEAKILIQMPPEPAIKKEEPAKPTPGKKFNLDH